MDRTIEIMGKRLKVVTDANDSPENCFKCAIRDICYNVMGVKIPFCKDTKGNANRHFELSD